MSLWLYIGVATGCYLAGKLISIYLSRLSLGTRGNTIIGLLGAAPFVAAYIGLDWSRTVWWIFSDPGLREMISLGHGVGVDLIDLFGGFVLGFVCGGILVVLVGMIKKFNDT